MVATYSNTFASYEIMLTVIEIRRAFTW